MKQTLSLYLLLLLCATSIAKGGKHKHSFSSYHSIYDDSTLIQGRTMPYNRFIDPSGSIIRFGNKDGENHALDCALLPDGKTLAVEHRTGITFINLLNNQVITEFELASEKSLKGLKSTFCGLKVLQWDGVTHVYWSVADGGSRAYVMDALWENARVRIVDTIPFKAFNPAPNALPNDLAINTERGEKYLYVVLNGNNQLVKLRLRDKQLIWTLPVGMAPYGIAIARGKAYVSNWAGAYPADPDKEKAGIPYGQVYIDHKTGGTLQGTVTVVDLNTGNATGQLTVGLHPNAVAAAPDGGTIYVANGNSDEVSVINTSTDKVTASISVRLGETANPYVGDQPNALAIDQSGNTLFVANGMDNAIAMIALKPSPVVKGFIPTQAYPGGLALSNQALFVCNIEGEGSWVKLKESYNVHHELATVSVISLPAEKDLPALTERVKAANLQFRTLLSQTQPRPDIKALPVPERIGEPSVIRHVLYIIKENRTYDQVLGDMKEGNGLASICIFGDSATPNEHELARRFLLLDNYYASGKSSAEGHQWTDAAMTSDYVEKSVRGWFRSYPHVQTDALVYNREGFIWNNALDHGRSVRIYGEACLPEWDGDHSWQRLFGLYNSKQTFDFHNKTTISRVEPVMSQTFPCGDVIEIPDQMRAEAFINELHHFESKPGDQWPELMVMALPNDHTAGTNPKFPTPKSMVADNDLALGKIIDAVSHSRFWDSTAIFVTEDDSQDGWDHVSGYRTVGFVLSPYSRLQRTVHTNYNQTCMVRTIEQILGLPPMNTIDATALPMFDCFSGKFDKTPFTYVQNMVALDKMNKKESELRGQELHFEKISGQPEYTHIDAGDDDLLNRILWFSAMGGKPYPAAPASRNIGRFRNGD